MKTVRYLGPLEGVELEVDGVLVDVERGETLDLPDELVDGVPHEFADGYKPKKDGPVDSTKIVVHGTAGVLEQTFVDNDNNVRPCWELVKAAKVPTAR